MPKLSSSKQMTSGLAFSWTDALRQWHSANALTENFRKCVSAVLASVVFFTPAQGSAQGVNTVVNIIPGWKIKTGWPYGHMAIEWSGMFGFITAWVCNYSKVADRKTGRQYYVTARHCLVMPSETKKHDFFKNDLCISEKLSDATVGRTVVSSDRPKTYVPSQYDSETIIGHRLTIVGGLPSGQGNNSSLWFSIAGKAELVYRDIVWIPVSRELEMIGIRVPKGQFVQMWKTQWQDSIRGMSGSPVLDDEGNLFGVLSMVTGPKTSASQSDYLVVYPLRK